MSHLVFQVAVALLAGVTLRTFTHRVEGRVVRERLVFACWNEDGGIVLAPERRYTLRQGADRRVTRDFELVSADHDWSAFGAAKAFVQADPQGAAQAVRAWMLSRR